MYQIRVLNDAKFDALPYRGAKEALGLADPKTNTAYIRNVHWGAISKDVKLLTIQHELDELLSKISPDEEDGIRYKKVKTWARPVSTILASVINPILGAAVAGTWSGYEASRGKESPWMVPANMGMAYLGGRFASAGRGGASALGAFKGGFGGAAKTGILGQLGRGIGSAVGVTPIGGNIANAAAAKLASGGVSGGIGFGAPGGVGFGAGVGKGVGFGAGVGGTGGIPATGALGTTGSTGAASALTLAGPNASKGLLSNPMLALGLGAQAWSALATSPEPPSIGPTVSKWLTQDSVTAAGKKAREMADVKYGGEFEPTAEIKGFMEVMGKDIEKAYKDRAKSLDETFSRVNPNWQSSGKRLETMTNLEDAKQREIDRMKAEWLLTAQREHATNQYNYIMSNIQADEATKRDLLYGDVTDITWKYQVKQQDLMNLRQVAANAGMYAMLGGMGAFSG